MIFKKFIVFFVCLILSYQLLGQNMSGDSWEKILKEKKGKVSVFWHNANPFFYQDKNGKLAGIEYEMLKGFFEYIAEQYGVTLDIHWVKAGSFIDAYQSVQQNPKSHGIFAASSFSITDKRKEEVNFTQSYLADIEVVISSNNVPIAKDLQEFQKITSKLTVITVPNTTFDANIKKLKEEYLGDIPEEKASDSNELLSHIIEKDNRFAYIHLPIYALALKENKRVKRQAFYKVEREGYGVIYPLQSDWKLVVDEYFARKEFKVEINQVIKRYLGDKVKDLIWSISGGNLKHNDEVELLTKEKELQALNLKKQELENQYQRFWNNALITGVLFSVLFGIVLFSRYYIKQKANKELLEKNREIEFQKQEIETKNTLLTDSIQYAKRIQESILPSWERFQTKFPESFLLYRPKDILSGDFYWFFETDKKLVLAVGDCTGHGVPGALMTMLGNSLLNYIVIEQKIIQSGKILTEMDMKILDLLKQENSQQQIDDGMDMAICVIDFEKEEIEFAGAKQSIYLFSQDILHKYKGSKYAIGGQDFENKSYETHKIKFQKDECLYILSDGLQDQFGGEENKKFLVSRLKETLTEIAVKDLKNQKEVLERSFERWKNDEEQTDDILCIGLRL